MELFVKETPRANPPVNALRFGRAISWQGQAVGILED